MVILTITVIAIIKINIIVKDAICIMLIFSSCLRCATIVLLLRSFYFLYCSDFEKYMYIYTY